MTGQWLFVGVCAVVGVGTAMLLAAVFSPEARLKRRRRKSHGRVVSKLNRPAVRLNVKPPKEDRRDGK